MTTVKSAFVLAAGKGERLRPLTLETPKPLLPIKGKPILDHILENLKPLADSHGLERVVLNAWYLANQIEGFVKSRQGKYPFEIVLSREGDLLGTGGGLKQAWEHLLGTPFLMINGDCVWKGNLGKFVDFALAQKSSSATWWLTEEKRDQTPVYVDENQIVQIGKLWTKKPGAKFRGCFSGIQVIQKLQAEKLPSAGSILQDYWLPRLDEGESLSAQTKGLDFWTDIGTPARYEEAEALSFR